MRQGYDSEIEFCNQDLSDTKVSSQFDIINYYNVSKIMLLVAEIYDNRTTSLIIDDSRVII